MSNIFESEFLNKYFEQALDKEDVTLEDLKEIENMAIINENLDEFVKISSEDLKILCSIGCKEFCFEGIDLNDVEFNEATITSLEFLRCKLSTCDFSKLQVEDRLAILDSVELKENGISQFLHMKNIKNFYYEDCEELDLTGIDKFEKLKYLKLQGNVTNISSIKNLQKLNKVETTGVKDVALYLPITEELETVVIDDKQIKDIEFLKNYPKLKHVTLSESKLDSTQLDFLCSMKKRGISIQFDETKIKEQLEQKEYKFEEEDLKKIKRAFHLSDTVQLNDYEIFNHQPYKNGKLEIENIETFNEIIKSGLLNEEGVVNKLGYINDVDFILESLEGISLEAIQYIEKNKDKKFRFVTRTLNGVDSIILEKLSENEENLEFYVKGDCFHFPDLKDLSNYEAKNIDFRELDNLIPYKLEDIKQFISILEPIKEQTLQLKSDIEKFAVIRKIALMRSRYDKSGVLNSNQFKEGREVITRSLKGIFLEGMAVCVGNALGFCIMAEYGGLHAKSIGGYYIEDKEGHEWNQIGIRDENDNINWYHYDVTNDPDLKDETMNINVETDILQSDDTFYKKWAPDKFEKVEKCTESISNNLIHDISVKIALKENTLEQLIEKYKYVAKEGKYSGRKLTKQDLKKILSTLTFSETKYITGLFSQAMKPESTQIR